MFSRFYRTTFTFLLATAALLHAQSNTNPSSPSLLSPGEEKHLRNIRQLTSGGQNAEAYFSADDKMLSFQHQGQGVPCDQSSNSWLK